MKVVIFCGGQGLRLRDYDQNTPKPMVPVGYRPIVWHLMRYYAHFGHTDFVLCLGHRADVVKDYFLNYNEALSNDFVLSGGGRSVKLVTSDIHNWTISFVDTGINACVGERLKAVRDYIGDDEMFLANYADCPTDAPLPAMIDHLRNSPGKIASFISVKPTASFHQVQTGPDGGVRDLVDSRTCDIWINGGYMVYRREVFDYIGEREDMVPTVFRKLINAGKLTTYRHEGFWACMDTFKEKMTLDDMINKGDAPWVVWKRNEIVGRAG